MSLTPSEEKPPLEERIFYFVMWLIVAGFVVVPVLLWLAGAGSTLGAFMFAPVVLLIALRFGSRGANHADDLPPDGKNEPT